MEKSIMVFFERAFWEISWNFFLSIRMSSCTFYKFLYDNFGGTQEYQMLGCFLHFWQPNQQMASTTELLLNSIASELPVPFCTRGPGHALWKRDSEDWEPYLQFQLKIWKPVS